MLFYFAILTHNRSLSLIALLDSIYQLEFPPRANYRIFVWDNSSDQEHHQQFSKSIFFNKKNLYYFRSVENVFMRGKYELEKLILKECDDQEECFLIHLDDDVQLTRTWLMNAFFALQNLGWDACGSVENWLGRLVFSGQTKLDIVEQLVDARIIRVWDWHWEPVPRELNQSSVEFAGHRALMVRMEIVQYVQHDPNLLIGGEDLDYSLTLRQAGYRIGIDHNALIYHRLLGEKDAKGFRTYDKVLHSWRRFYRKWGIVRRNASLEAGVSEEKWLRLVTQL